MLCVCGGGNPRLGARVRAYGLLRLGRPARLVAFSSALHRPEKVRGGISAAGEKDEMEGKESNVALAQTRLT